MVAATHSIWVSSISGGQAVRLDSESDHPEHDLQHMNADYGALILEAALDRLAGNSDRR